MRLVNIVAMVLLLMADTTAPEQELPDHQPIVLEQAEEMVLADLFSRQNQIDASDVFISRASDRDVDDVEVSEEEAVAVDEPNEESEGGNEARERVVARVTAYAPFDNQSGICSDGNPNRTSTGQRPGPTIIAVDPQRIPYGTEVEIEGFDRTFVAGDTGGALRRYDGIAIDVFFETYAAARSFGVQYLDIEIIDDD